MFDPIVLYRNWRRAGIAVAALILLAVSPSQALEIDRGEHQVNGIGHSGKGIFGVRQCLDALRLTQDA